MSCRCNVLRTCAATLGSTTLVLLIVIGLAGAAFAAEPLSRPDWSAIFNPEGNVLDLKGGVDAFFLEDKISDGIGVDMSVVVPAEKATVDTGVITAANDLGNGYVYAKRDGSGNLQVYAGVERMESQIDSYVEFEFNQAIVGVYSGAPWPVRGARAVGDIAVRVAFMGGALNSATFSRWDGTAYRPIAAVGAEACNGADYLVCAGSPPLNSVQAEVWDLAGQPVAVPAPDRFVEVGFNVAAMPGSNPEFTSVQVRTAEDIVLGSFRHFGLWARSPWGGR